MSRVTSGVTSGVTIRVIFGVISKVTFRVKSGVRSGVKSGKCGVTYEKSGVVFGDEGGSMGRNSENFCETISNTQVLTQVSSTCGLRVRTWLGSEYGLAEVGQMGRGRKGTVTNVL